MKRLQAREATDNDIRSLSQRLREADLREIEATGWDDPYLALSSPLEDSLVLVGVDEDDVAQLIFGVGPGPVEGLGIVWLMASTDIKKHWVQLLRETRLWVQRLGAGYSALANMVHADNKLHIRWLKWSGFIFLREVSYNGHKFYEFAKIVNHEEDT